ncbi:MAG: hypothetical protein LBT37_03820 [Lactobacillaceae bacterium]|jgi:hypothetical protein|nr:hypothetical protein [Lactobacillaceae bacterium]
MGMLIFIKNPDTFANVRYGIDHSTVFSVLFSIILGSIELIMLLSYFTDFWNISELVNIRAGKMKRGLIELKIIAPCLLYLLGVNFLLDLLHKNILWGGLLRIGITTVLVVIADRLIKQKMFFGWVALMIIIIGRVFIF